MSCGCAARMRRFVLPKMGYEIIGEWWLHKTEPPISNAEVEVHYTRLMTRLVAQRGEAVVKRWLDRLIRWERAQPNVRF